MADSASVPLRLPPSLAQLLGIRDFVLLWSGSTVSLLGDGVYFVAIAWEVYRLSNSPTALGVVGAAFSLPQVLLLLVGGVVSDRIDRRRVMIAGNVGSAAAVGAIGVLTQLQAVALWEIWVLVVVYGISQAFFMPASRALVPTLVPTDLLPQASAVEQFVQPVAMSLVGPAVGGGLVALGGSGVALLLDGASFGVAAVTLAMISSPAARARPAGAPASVLREAGQALGFVRSQPWIWAGLLAAALANITLTGPQQVLVPYILKFHLHGSPSDLGLIYAGGGLGAIAAAVYIAIRGMPRRSVTWIFLPWAVSTLAVAPIGMATAAWQVMGLALVINSGIALGNMIWFALMGALVPNQMLGRVSSFDMAISFSLTPISNGVTGPVAGALGARLTLLGAGVIAGVTTAAFLLVPGVREPEGRRAGRTDPRP
ncbi:MAG: MFS transporter [Candidatus Dormibacteraceae bacterium]